MDVDRPSLSTRLVRVAAVAIPVAFLAVFFAYPLGAILERGLTGGDAPGSALDVLTDTRTVRIAWFTLWQAVVSTALTLAVGLPLAWATARFSFRGRSLVRAAVLVPFVLPTIVVATAFLAVLPEELQSGVPAILIAHVYFNVAVVVYVVGSYWEALDQRVWDAAATLGSSPLRRAREVTLPLLRPALSASAALVFLFCFTSFGVVIVLGGPTRATLEVEIYNQAARAFDLTAAAVLALVQLAVVAAAAVVSARLEARNEGTPRLAAEPPPRPRGRTRAAVAAVLALGGLFLALPPLLLLRESLTTPSGLGFDWYRALAEETPALLVEPWRTIPNSLLFAAVATAIAILVGGPAAWAVARRTHGSWLSSVALLPLGASAVMIGFGFLIAFDEPPLALRSSVWIVPIAQALVALPFVVRVAAPSLRAIDVRLHEAAATLGASPGRTWREIDLPLAARALAVAAAFAFAISLGEFGATVFLARSDWPTVPVAMFRFLGRPGAANAGVADALAVVLMALTAASAYGLSRLAGRERRA